MLKPFSGRETSLSAEFQSEQDTFVFNFSSCAARNKLLGERKCLIKLDFARNWTFLLLNPSALAHSLGHPSARCVLSQLVFKSPMSLNGIYLSDSSSVACLLTKNISPTSCVVTQGKYSIIEVSDAQS